MGTNKPPSNPFFVSLLVLCLKFFLKRILWISDTPCVLVNFEDFNTKQDFCNFKARGAC